MITQGKGLGGGRAGVLAAVFGAVSAQAQVTLRLPATVDANVGTSSRSAWT
jgi:hypothetical protein